MFIKYETQINLKTMKKLSYVSSGIALLISLNCITYADFILMQSMNLSLVLGFSAIL